jgi:hypothetical protein
MVITHIAVEFKTWSKINNIAKLTGVKPGVVVANLLKHWEVTTSSEAKSEHPHEVPDASDSGPGGALPSAAVADCGSVLSGVVKLWRSSRGEFLPVGLKLRAPYLGQQFTATVTSSGIEFEGTTYESPSKAGVAVKKSLGKSDSAASTNGWEFWEAYDSESQVWKPLSNWKSENAARN